MYIKWNTGFEIPRGKWQISNRVTFSVRPAAGLVTVNCHLKYIVLQISWCEISRGRVPRSNSLWQIPMCEQAFRNNFDQQQHVEHDFTQVYEIKHKKTALFSLSHALVCIAMLGALVCSILQWAAFLRILFLEFTFYSQLNINNVAYTHCTVHPLSHTHTAHTHTIHIVRSQCDGSEHCVCVSSILTIIIDNR